MTQVLPVVKISWVLLHSPMCSSIHNLIEIKIVVSSNVTDIRRQNSVRTLQCYS